MKYYYIGLHEVEMPQEEYEEMIAYFLVLFDDITFENALQLLKKHNLFEFFEDEYKEEIDKYIKAKYSIE